MSNLLSIEGILLRWWHWNQKANGIPKPPSCLMGKMLYSTAHSDDIDPLSDDEAEIVNVALKCLK